MADITHSQFERRGTDAGSSPSSKPSRKALRRAEDPPLADYRHSGKIRQFSPAIVAGLVKTFEFALVVALGLGIFYAYIDKHHADLIPIYITASLSVAALMTFTFHALQLYDLPAFFSLPRQISRIGLGWTLTFAIFLLAMFLFQVSAEYSRIWLTLWYVSGIASLIAVRIAVFALVKSPSHDGLFDRRAVIVGGGKQSEELIKSLEASSDTDIRICGIFDDRKDDRIDSNVNGYPVLGNIDELIEFARKTHVDLLIVSLPLTAQSRLLELFKRLWVLPVDISLSAHANSVRFRPRTYSYIGNVPLIAVQDKPIADWDWVLKWLFDKTVALTALVLLSPVMALIALAVKWDSPGPIFFKQRRYGFNNELIEVFKFRSMYTDQCDHTASKLVTKGDSRVTRVGRFIRKTSLDELPQFFNVLRGELSIVGPRPHATQAKAAEQLYDEVVDGYFARHRVKPGITGWAQINGWRGETDTQEKIQRRVEHDLYYIENWSVFFDTYILFMTPFKILETENAY